MPSSTKEKGPALLSDRLAYVAAPDRPVLQGPHDNRLLVWVIVNVEHWSIERAMPRTVLSPPMGQPLLPDLPNWSWHEYGMRAGFWRLFDALHSRGIVPTMAVNGIVCESYPRVARAALDAGWEFMGHGYVQGPMHKLEDQAQAIRQTIESIKAFTGKAPRGWESPGLTETDQTLDHLSAAGIDYVADWVVDDQPAWIQAKPRPVLSVPYTVEINDIPMMLLQNHRSDELYHRGALQMERLWQEGGQNPRVMAISVHPYITGVPHRIAAFERLLDAVLSKPRVGVMTGEAIADWYSAQVPAPKA
ncbi:MAG: polysaccharide deacetylase family protein [Quisquiliibacterium sp.]